ncbi:MAG: hypothetical protein P1S60_08160 [Anaerolineae bacterium]|nr:hypothetical protein [Anaerolineae bacterium]
MIFASVFSIVVGVGMVGQWAMSYISNQIPELETEPIRIRFHILAEIVTAALLIFSGIGLLKSYNWAIHMNLVAHGMLIYTSIVSPGYFAQKGQWLWLVMFSLIVIFSVVSIFSIV